MGTATITSKSIRECITCRQVKFVENQGRCAACHKYLRKYGRERPITAIHAAAERSKRAKWCTVCGHPKTHCRERCAACYRYWMKSGFKRDRPRHMWDKDATCRTCGRPLWVKPGSNGRCLACYKFFNRTHRDRPRHLWGIGPVGWCECGEPAITIREKMTLCAGCANDFR